MFDINIYTVYDGMNDNINVETVCLLQNSQCQNISTYVVSKDDHDYDLLSVSSKDTVIRCPDNNKDCYTFSYAKYDKVTTINCPVNGINSCILTCIEYNGCRDVIINGTDSNKLIINFQPPHHFWPKMRLYMLQIMEVCTCYLINGEDAFSTGRSLHEIH